jgi:hypothetical protein
MPDANAPFMMLDEAAVAAAELRHDPCDFASVEHALAPALEEAVLADAPEIPDRGSYALTDLPYGRDFAAVIRDLLSVRFRRLIEGKFDIDLGPCLPVIGMMGNANGRYNEGYAHPDSKHKIITVFLGLSREWPYERGRPRVLRRDDRNDCAFEFAPGFGRMLMFRVCDHSWHGFPPQGRRMSLQLRYVDSEWYVRKERWRHRVSAYARSVPLLRKVIDFAPRH